MPSSSNGREEHAHTEQRHASQDGSDGPTPKRARVEAPDTPAEGGTARLALPAPQAREPISSSAAPQAPALHSGAAASEVDLQAAQQVIGNILLDCRQSGGASQAANPEEAVQAEAAGPAGAEQGAAGGAAESRPGSMGNGGQRRVGRTLKTARKTHALPRMAGAPKPKPKPGRKPGSTDKSAGRVPKAKARKPTQLALSRSKAGGEASGGDATAEASASQEAVAEVLNGPSEETIAQADLKYKLTTPHQAGAKLWFFTLTTSLLKELLSSTHAGTSKRSSSRFETSAEILAMPYQASLARSFPEGLAALAALSQAV